MLPGFGTALDQRQDQLTTTRENPMCKAMKAAEELPELDGEVEAPIHSLRHCTGSISCEPP